MNKVIQAPIRKEEIKNLKAGAVSYTHLDVYKRQLITCTGVDEFVNHRFSINKIFYVHEGQVRNEN